MTTTAGPPGMLTADLSLLRQRRFALLLTSRTISIFGNAFGPVAIAFGVLALPGATAGTLSTVLAGNALPQLGLMLLGGVIGDRLPRHRVLVAAETLSGCAFAALAAMLLTGWAPLPLLVGVAFVAGCASALLLPSLTGVLTDVVDSDRLRPANALLRLAGNCATIGGVAIAGTAVAVLGPGVALAIDAATYFVAATLLTGLRTPGPAARVRRGVWADLREGFREFTGRQWLWVVVGSAAVLNAGTAATFTVLGPILAVERIGAIAWSVILVGYTAGMLLSVVAILRIQPGRPLRTAVLVTPLLAAPLAAMGFGAPVAITAAAAFCAGAAFNVFSVLWETTLQQRVPAAALSRLISCNYVFALSLKPAGIYLAGHFATGLGVGPTTLTVGAVLLVAGLAPLASPQVRQLTDDTGGA
ncbi:MFS transporter [Micromonospora sp. NPDC051141]|uniref:MFS transporter n=1 Tax=Micromonospora sp. NPDC051141 TaxID=3364284 RepID=UPI0037B79C03